MDWISCGLDLGVQSVKLVALNENLRIKHHDAEPVKGNLFLALKNLFDRIPASTESKELLISVTGAGKNTLIFPGNTFRVNEISALAYGLSQVFPDAQAVFDIGAESARWIALNPGSVKETIPEIIDFSLNERCAAGTGSFLEKQAIRLGLSIEDFSSLAVKAKKGSTIAGRCSVFARSDMVHLQQKGTPVEEIAYGVCLALVRSVISSLLRGKTCPRPIALAGNTIKNGGILRALQQVLRAGESDLLYSDLSPYLGALGAAYLGLNQHNKAKGQDLKNFLSQTKLVTETRFFDLPPLGQVPASKNTEPAVVFKVPVKGYLGIDIGSVSTNLVIMAENSEVLAGIYLPTRGQPVEALKQGLSELVSRFPAGLEILGIGTTGSGRYLAGRLLKADIIKNEITSQMGSACHFFPEVDTIFEIGGQDSKFIQVDKGKVVDFNLNKICAAGTGSFLEEQANQIGFSVENDFAALASASNRPYNLGSRCTVFMESELLRASTRSQPLPDLVAGLAYSIARNYLEKVVERRSVGQNIVFQGGVASNQAVVKAFSKLLGKEIKVHPYNRISGAIGAALEARSRVRKIGKKSPGLKEIQEKFGQPVQLESFECQHCSNRCQVIAVNSGNDRVYFGDICERYTSTLKSKSVQREFHNPLVFRKNLLEQLSTFNSSSGPVVGLPRASALQEFLPFWQVFFTSLGYRIKISPETGPEIMEAGIKFQPAETCLPVKAAIGHLKILQDDSEVDLVFMPGLVDTHLSQEESFYFCLYTENLPNILPEEIRDKLLTTQVYLEPVGTCQKPSLENLTRLLKEPEEKIQQAWQSAWQAQIEFNQKLKEEGKILLEKSVQQNQPVLIISGRPYLLYDNYANLNLWFHLEKLGITAIPVDYLPLEEISLSELPVEASAIPPWRYPQRMFKVAAFCRRQSQIFPVFLSSYGCGVDGFAIKQLKNLLEGIPHLMLEFDEHRGEAGLITRLEAFADEISHHKNTERKLVTLKKIKNPEGLPPEEIRKFPFYIPYFADHAMAFAGALKKVGITAEVLPMSDDRSLELGEKYSSGKECHAYTYLLGDLLKLALETKDTEPQILFFPGAKYSCLLQQYGPSMRNLLLELGKTRTMVLTPTLDYIWKLLGFDALKSLWQGLVAIDNLGKLACQLRPYELNPGETDRALKKGLKLIEEGIATGHLASALKKTRADFRQIKTRPEPRPVIGIAGDIYTRQNSFANKGLFRRLEELGCEVWPAPFLVDEVDFTFSRGFYEKLSEGNLKDVLLYSSLNLVKEIKKHQVKRKLEITDLKIKEPGFKNLIGSTMAYLNYNNNQSLFLNVARMIDFASKGADGVINVICFNCMLGTVSAAISARIRKEFGNIPLPTLIYGETETDSTGSRLEAFVDQVKSRFRKKDHQPFGTDYLTS